MKSGIGVACTLESGTRRARHGGVQCCCHRRDGGNTQKLPKGFLRRYTKNVQGKSLGGKNHAAWCGTRRAFSWTGLVSRSRENLHPKKKLCASPISDTRFMQVTASMLPFAAWHVAAFQEAQARSSRTQAQFYQSQRCRPARLKADHQHKRRPGRDYDTDVDVTSHREAARNKACGNRLSPSARAPRKFRSPSRTVRRSRSTSHKGIEVVLKKRPPLRSDLQHEAKIERCVWRH